MGRVGAIISPGAKVCQMYAERLLGGVTQANYARFARPGGVEMKSNHMAFVLGHLALYPARIFTFLGLPPGSAVAPSSYEGLFKAGVECQDDPDGRIYPPLAELRSRFFDGYRAAIAAIESAPDEAFDPPNPVEGRPREMFPTIGAMLNFYVTGHVQVHLGQVSAWRRAMGLPAA